MADREVWVRCPKAVVEFGLPPPEGSGTWWCDCHKYDTLVRVPGALLIEDREAAVGRIVSMLLAAFNDADQGMAAISGGRFGFRPETAWVCDLAAKALRAALNEGKEERWLNNCGDDAAPSYMTLCQS